MECGFHSGGHVVVHHTVLRIEFATDLVALLRVEVRDESHQYLTQILVADAEGVGLLILGLGEGGSLRLIALADTDSKDLVSGIGAILHIGRVAQVLQNTLAEGDRVLIDEQVRGSVGGDVDNLKVDVRKIDSHSQ